MGKEAGFLPKIPIAPSLDEIPNFYKTLFLTYRSQPNSIKDKKPFEQFPLSVRDNIVGQTSPNESDLAMLADYICSLKVINMTGHLTPKTLALLEKSQPYLEAYQQSSLGKKEIETITQNSRMLGLSDNQTIEILNQSLKNYYKAIDKSGIDYFGQENSPNLSADSNDNINTSKNFENKIIDLIKAFHLRYRQTTETLLFCKTQLQQEIPNHEIPELTLLQLLKKVYLYSPTLYSDLIKKRTDFITLEVIDSAIKYVSRPEKWIYETNKKATDLKKQYPHATNRAIFQYLRGACKIDFLIRSENRQKRKQVKQSKILLDKPKNNIESKTNKSRKRSHIPLVTEVDPILKQKYQDIHHPFLTDLVIDNFLKKFSQPDIEIERAKSTYDTLVEQFKVEIKKNSTILKAIIEAILLNEKNPVSFVSKYIARFNFFKNDERYFNIIQSILASTTIRLVKKEISLEKAILILEKESKQW